MRIEVEQHAGRYEFISQIATGPLGGLWAARVTDGAETGRIVAIRRILKVSPVDGPLEQQLIAAAFAAMDVRDPKLAAVLDVIVNRHEIAVVSEYVEGEMLRSLQRRAGLKNRPMDIRIGLRIGLDTLQALQAALQREARTSNSGGSAFAGGLSPDHLLVATFGEVVLLDPAIAATAMKHRAVAHHPDVCVYRAPEQLEGDRPITERADVFTAGVVLWELLANRPLFGPPKWTRYSNRAAPEELPADSQTSYNLRKRVRDAKIARLDAVVRAGERVPSPIADVVAMALERDLAKRHPSIVHMIQALESLGPQAIASHEEVAQVLRESAGTSVEARRVALASFAGTPQAQPEKIDSTLPTKPPQRDETALSGAALVSDSVYLPKPPLVPSSPNSRTDTTDAGRTARKIKPPLPGRRRNSSED